MVKSNKNFKYIADHIADLLKDKNSYWYTESLEEFCEGLSRNLDLTCKLVFIEERGDIKKYSIKIYAINNTIENENLFSISISDNTLIISYDTLHLMDIQGICNNKDELYDFLKNELRKNIGKIKRIESCKIGIKP